MATLYNEIDKFAAQWLRNLIAAGHLPEGVVDERSIEDIRPDELAGFTQCHFFAGIGGWPLALRLAGWPEDRPVWTGSCPCQPFSAAGKGAGFDDERHLWPSWHWLVQQSKPAIVLGEQVDAAVRGGWLDLVFDDLEAEGYACGAVVLPACSVGAPHRRQRIWWVADARVAAGERDAGSVLGAQAQERGQNGPQHGHLSVGHSDGGATRELADADGRHAGAEGLQRGREHGQRPEDSDALADALPAGWPERRAIAGDRSIASGGASGVALGDADQPRPQGRRIDRDGPDERAVGAAGVAGGWDDIEWLPCTDGKARPTQSGLFPLAHGVPGRVGRLRAYGNAIVPQVAAEFVKTAMIALATATA